jgi:sporulation protein YlmC with PRC-barrel domain
VPETDLYEGVSEDSGRDPAKPLEQFIIGAEVRCRDGECGEISRVVMDPVAGVVTHLVVEPRHRRQPGRLVPLDLVEPGLAPVTLNCDLAGFADLKEAEETQFVPSTAAYGGYGLGRLLSWPYYGLGAGGMSRGRLGGGGPVSQAVTYDKVPLGEVAVRRGERVHATDGEIGRVQGLVIDPGDHQVTHVLLQEGHLWGSREVAIPIGSVSEIDRARRLPMDGGSSGRARPVGMLAVDELGVRVKLTMQQVRDLPEVQLSNPDSLPRRH